MKWIKFPALEVPKSLPQRHKDTKKPLCITIRQLFVFFARKFWSATGNRFITVLLRQKFSPYFFAAFFSSSYLLNFSSSLVAAAGRAGYLCALVPWWQKLSAE
jgi:hypothetical protein